MVFATQLRVRYQETDQMGVVYHSNYLTWFEIGRTEMIRSLGVPYAEFEERGILLPVININASFKSPARYDDIITVQTRVKNYTGVRITFQYDVIHHEDDRLLVTGESEHVWVNQEFRPINLKKAWPEVDQLIHSTYLS